MKMPSLLRTRHLLCSLTAGGGGSGRSSEGKLKWGLPAMALLVMNTQDGPGLGTLLHVHHIVPPSDQLWRRTLF